MNNDNYKNMEMINGNGKTPSNNPDILREKFVESYCNKKKWDKDNLTNEQITEIKTQKGYINPGMICG